MLSIGRSFSLWWNCLTDIDSHQHFDDFSLDFHCRGNWQPALVKRNPSSGNINVSSEKGTRKLQNSDCCISEANFSG